MSKGPVKWAPTQTNVTSCINNNKKKKKNNNNDNSDIKNKGQHKYDEIHTHCNTDQLNTS